MASYQKTESGWRVQIDVRGQRASTTRPTKREATAWAEEKTREFRAVNDGDHGHGKTLRDALRKYAEDVSPKKRGEAWEIIRLTAFEKPDHRLPVTRLLSQVTDDDIRAWRDRRLTVVTRGTVIRDMTLLASVFEHARLEWRWVKANPVRDVKKPTSPAHRSRLISGLELRGVLRALGYSRKPARSVSQAVALAVLLALATGMRAGELCKLRWDDVKPDYCTVRDVKAVERGVSRDVPFSPVARRLVARMVGWDDMLVFNITTATLDALFRKARKKAALDGFTFHDTRHTAATRIARQIGVLDLCKVFGWSDPKMAMIYFNPTASSIALQLR